MNRIEMKALKYQSVPLGNERSFVDKDGKFFVTSEEEAAARTARGLAERLSPEPEAEEASLEKDKVKEDEPWTMQVSPEAYLAKWPEGPNADQARAEIARAKAAADSENES